MELKTKKKIVGLYQAHKSKIKLIGFIVLGIALSFSGLFETLTLLSAFILVAAYALLLK